MLQQCCSQFPGRRATIPAEEASASSINAGRQHEQILGPWGGVLGEVVSCFVCSSQIQEEKLLFLMSNEEVLGFFCESKWTKLGHL